MYKIADPVNPNHLNHYVSNERFYDEITEYHYAYKAAKERGEELPQISNYLGACVQKIATGLAMKSNFRNYSFIKDMISAAIEDCIRHMHSFDPTKSRNPFAYYTQACYFAFIHQIQKEKRQTITKKHILMNSALDLFSLQGHEDDREFVIPLIQYLNDIDLPMVEPKKERISSRPISNLDGFFDE